MDDNGRWRKVESYTLYGSTVCLTCQDATATVPSVDDQIQGSGSASTPQSAPSATTTYDIHDDLPPGWKPTTASGGGRTMLILALSLVLAFAICFLIISCIFWRKTKRRKRKPDDVEMKARKRRKGRAADDASESMLALEREVKVKQRIWARATARWKANAKYSARQRRGKRIASTTKIGSPQSCCASLDRIEDAEPAHPTPPSSPREIRRLSLDSVDTGTSGDVSTSAPPPQEETQADVIAPIPSSSASPSPPAYHLRTSIPQIRISRENLAGDTREDRQLTPSHLSPLGSQLASSSNIRQYDLRDTSSDTDFASQRIHAAHVATDDKALLARLADLASAPPDDAHSSQSDSATFHASVPIWQDEELEDFMDPPYNPVNCSLPASRRSSRSSSPPPLFPPPPKGKKAAASFHDYHYSFEDISVEPEPGPSAPPFEEEPSCPIVMPNNLVPSAPPLSDMTVAYCFEAYASAPTSDWEASTPLETSDSGETIAQAQHQGTIPTTGNTDSRPLEPHVDHSIPLVQGPVASDGTPPSYHP
ncbi:hypothetical protein LshimejAT787_0300790 [Lyophyllum shimeji]|uniref:Uncharacterized protein n=1 Tax=Lyophyllum shimeji TaxID=47721 RepID=A0A9P3PHY0_LYOSH|nr:hypothetical protein LshimejAT787_0300790 [Lyophyllum shimeji]